VVDPDPLPPVKPRKSRAKPETGLTVADIENIDLATLHKQAAKDAKAVTRTVRRRIKRGS